MNIIIITYKGFTNNPLVYQYQADEYYELIKCCKIESNEKNSIEPYKEISVDNIKKAIDLYSRAIINHKIEILKKKDEFIIPEKNSLEIHYVKGLENKKSDELGITDEFLADIGYLDRMEYEQAFRNCAYLQHMLGKSDSAIELLEEVMIIVPKDHDARNMLGCVYCDNNNFEKSIEQFIINKSQMVPAIYDNSYTCMLLGITYWKQYTLLNKNKKQTGKKFIGNL